jgi:hypothetical protein
MVHFDFTYSLVEKHNSLNGNVSIPTPVIVKLMLLFLYDVPSERKLMRTLLYCLDWLGFLGYDLDSEIKKLKFCQEYSKTITERELLETP